VDLLGAVGELGAPAAARRLGSSVPLWRQRCSSLTTQLGLTSNFAAVARREAPASTARTIRCRRITTTARRESQIDSVRLDNAL